jgi:hypothetical protein
VLFKKYSVSLNSLYPGREGCQGRPPVLACAWAVVYGTSGVNKRTSMLHTEVGFLSS